MKANESKTPKYLAIAVWALIGAGIGWQANAWTGQDATLSLGSGNGEEEADLDLFWEVWRLLDEDYIEAEETPDEDRVYGAISGMVNALGDPYTAFMNPDEAKSFSQSLNSELEGIGAELTVREGKLVVVAPIKDSPAEEAGILPGDHIYMVNGLPTAEMSLWDAIMAIRGEPGTDVNLTIIREGAEEATDLTITRSKIHVPSIETSYEEVNGKTLAHVAVYSFADETYLEFSDAIRDIQLQGADGMILDLRLNGGGFLDVSIEMLSEFFEDEVKAVVVKNGDGTNEIMYTLGQGDLTEIPLVVLIDEGSASASEIVAGALQDHGRAVLMGEKSFGKGSVQELTELMGGASIRITVAKWFTPKDRSIDHEGIAPDVLIEMDGVAVTPEEDTQLQAALDYLSELE